MTDPIGTAQERELIERVALALLQSHFRASGVAEPTELGAFDDQYRKDARTAIEVLNVQSRIAEVGRLEERVRMLEEEITDLWHSSDVQQAGPLHEYLHMTPEEYAAWANPAALSLHRRPT